MTTLLGAYHSPTLASGLKAMQHEACSLHSNLLRSWEQTLGSGKYRTLFSGFC